MKQIKMDLNLKSDMKVKLIPEPEVLAVILRARRVLVVVMLAIHLVEAVVPAVLVVMVEAVMDIHLEGHPADRDSLADNKVETEVIHLVRLVLSLDLASVVEVKGAVAADIHPAAQEATVATSISEAAMVRHLFYESLLFS